MPRDLASDLRGAVSAGFAAKVSEEKCVFVRGGGRGPLLGELL